MFAVNGRAIRAFRLQLLIVSILLSSGARAFQFAPPSACGRACCRPPLVSTPPFNPLLPLEKSKRTNRKRQTWLQTASIKSSIIPAGPTVKKSVTSAAILVVLDIVFRRLFWALAISFPSSLAGCGALFVSMLALPFGERLYSALSPGSTLLAKWLPVFFVPSLVILPLADGLGSAAEFAKVTLVITGGFLFTLFSTALSVMGVREVMSSSSSKHTLPAVAPPLEEIINEEQHTDESSSTQVIEDDTPPQKAFSDKLLGDLCILQVASGLTATVAYRMPGAAPMTTPLTTAVLLFSTLYSFVLGARLSKRITKFVHPLVTCTLGTWLSAKGFGLINGFSFPLMLRKYRTGKVTLAGAGAGDILLFLLGPAVISLACQMYDRRKLIKENFAEVATAVAVSSVGGLFGTACAVRVLAIGNPAVRLSLLSRNITSPLAMAIASILGGDVSLAVSMVVVTGLIGANFGAAILDALGVTDAVARGLGIGAAAHGLGTAAFANEEDAFPFAAIAMALTASACTVLVSIPFVKRIVLQVALGW